MAHFRGYICLMVLSFALLGCDEGFKAKGSDEASDLSTIDFNSEYLDIPFAELETKASEVLQTRCASCHSAGGTGAAAIPDIMDTNDLLRRGLIVPNHPVNSKLFVDVWDGRMPSNGESLTKDELEIIQIWIYRGVQEVPDPILLSDGVQTVFEANCLSCHSLIGGNAGGVNLESYDEIMKYVSPTASPDESVLFDSVVTGRMPTTPTKLQQRDLAIIYNWLWAGANE